MVFFLQHEMQVHLRERERERKRSKLTVRVNGEDAHILGKYLIVA
jgi:hypothetical protein